MRALFIHPRTFLVWLLVAAPAISLAQDSGGKAFLQAAASR